MLTREQAIKKAGKEAIERLEKEHCEPTCRVGFCGYQSGDELTEWKATTHFDDDGEENYISAIYYTKEEEDKVLEINCDGADIDWKIAGYIVEL